MRCHLIKVSKVIYCRGDILLPTCFTATGEGEVQNLSFQLEFHRLQSDVKGCASQMQTLSTKLTSQDEDISAIKEELKQLLSELSKTRIALSIIADKL